MIHKSEFQKSHPEMREGMTAYTLDGEKLGTVRNLEEDSLIVEKGFFFPKDFTFRYDDVADVRTDSLIINQEEGRLKDWRNEKYEGWNEYERRDNDQPRRGPETRSDTEIRSQTGMPMETEVKGQADLPKEQATTKDAPKMQSDTEKMGMTETRTNIDRTEIPLYEERLETEKIKHEKGEATIRKVVHTEVKNIEVPVTMEEVVIERMNVEGEGTAPGEKAFKEEEIHIPISEEEVRVTKHPFERERVEIRKQTHVENKKFSEELRSEDVEVEQQGDVKKEKK